MVPVGAPAGPVLGDPRPVVLTLPQPGCHQWRGIRARPTGLGVLGRVEPLTFTKRHPCSPSQPSGAANRRWGRSVHQPRRTSERLASTRISSAGRRSTLTEPAICLTRRMRNEQKGAPRFSEVGVCALPHGPGTGVAMVWCGKKRRGMSPARRRTLVRWVVRVVGRRHAPRVVEQTVCRKPRHTGLRRPRRTCALTRGAPGSRLSPRRTTDARHPVGLRSPAARRP